MRKLFALTLWLVISGSALAQLTAPPNVADELLGGVVFAAGGAEIGKVAGVAVGPEGTVTELRITTAAPQGLGERTVIVPPDRYILLRGAVVLDLSPSEVDALPSAPPRYRD